MTKDEALAWETVATKAVAAEQSNSGMTLEDYGTLYYPSAEAARVLAARVRELEAALSEYAHRPYWSHLSPTNQDPDHDHNVWNGPGPGGNGWAIAAKALKGTR